MLRGEGNENGEKNNNRSSWQKKTLHLQHTCFVHFFAVVLHDYKVKLPETSWLHVLWKKCRTFSFSFFFFSLPHFFTLVAVNISYFPIIIIILFIYSALFNMLGDQKRKKISQKFSCYSSDKKMSLLSFISRSRSLSLFFLVELRWPVAYFLFFFVSVFLCIPKLWT